MTFEATDALARLARLPGFELRLLRVSIVRRGFTVVAGAIPRASAPSNCCSPDAPTPQCPAPKKAARDAQAVDYRSSILSAARSSRLLPSL
jgi:hypothetical protein